MYVVGSVRDVSRMISEVEGWLSGALSCATRISSFLKSGWTTTEDMST
jgi:hypothetical protein